MADALLTAAFACIAIFYSAVGQAGGTGYVAVMGLVGMTPDTIKSTALALNILVATIGCVRFYGAGLLTWRTCYPFAILGAPFSFIGGTINLPAALYQPVVGGLLLLAAVQIVRSARSASRHDAAAPIVPPFLPSLAVGGFIGLVSGITGIGGGIFLAPLVLMLGWTSTRQAAAVTMSFNLINSAAALAGVWATAPAFPSQLPVWMVAVGVGGLIGSWVGVVHLKPGALRLLLAVLLLTAGIRMVAAPLL